MSLFATNWDELTDRGAIVDNAEYVFLHCANCGRIVIYDLERMQLYQDPRRLRVSTLYGTNADDSAQCSGCGRVTEFLDTEESDRLRIAASEWGRFL